MKAINELFELTVAVCDKLYAEKQLITKTAVKQAILAQGERWDEEELDQSLANYLNQWRLNNLKQDNVASLNNKLKNYKLELESAYQIISMLKKQIKGMLDA